MVEVDGREEGPVRDRRRHLRLLPPVRPRTRGDCRGGVRPCGWVSCRHHMVHAFGKWWREGTEDELADLALGLAHTCTIDVADKGEHTLEEVGDVVGLTRERVRQIEAQAIERLRVGERAKRLREVVDWWGEGDG